MEIKRSHSFRIPVKLKKQDWKTELRKRCLQRARKSREDILRKLRNSDQEGSAISNEIISNSFQQLILDELKNIETHSSTLPLSLPLPLPTVDHLEREKIESQFDILLNNETKITEILKTYDLEFPDSSSNPILSFENRLFDNLTVEECEQLILEMEVAFQSEAHDRLMVTENEFNFQSNSLLTIGEEKFENYFPSNEQESDVLCPICNKHYLIQNLSIIYCKCGSFHLDTQQDHLTIGHLKRRLEDVVHEHATSNAINCMNYLNYYVEKHFGISALYATCTHCRFMQLVL